MRRKFDQQLDDLNTALIEMGKLVENAISLATKAFLEQDTELAAKIIDMDREIDDKEKEVETLALRLMLLQQPVAGDLRYISSVLKIITDLERIGDHAEDISEITLVIADQAFIKKLDYIPKMAKATLSMVSNCIDAFIKRDLELAYAVIGSDDVVDDLFVLARDVLVELIRENPENGSQAIDLMIVAKYFERIGDHATNVAEWVVFSLTGMHKDWKVL